MSDSDRLKELQRQRALAQEQAAALEREIAREMGAAAAPSAVPTPSPSAPPPGSAADAQAEQIIERYAEQAKPVHDQVKQGCLVYLAVAFGLVGACVLALYLYRLTR